MNVKYFRQTSLAVLITAVLTGCGTFSNLDEVVPDNTQKYRKAETMPPLDVPPDLSTARINDDIVGGRDSTASYSEFQEAATNPLAARYNITPEQKPALAGEGAGRHLVVPGERDVTWQRIQDFWEARGLGIHRMDARIGLLDTMADGDDYAYRVRMERGDTSRSVKVFLGAVDESRRNPQKDEAMLRQLAEHLGALQQQDADRMQAAQPAPPPEETARVLLLDEEGGHQTILVEQEFSTVWTRVGRVLDSKGFSVEDRDRTRGLYFVRYIDPFKEIEPREEGFLSRLAFWRDNVDVAPEEYYYIKLISDASDTRIIILDAEESRTASDTARRLLNLIQEQLAP